MRKSVFVRFLGFLGLYFLIFVVIASIQFTKKGDFSLRVFNLAVEGRYRIPEEGESLPPDGLSPLDGEARVVYGGLEFILSGDSSGGGLGLVDAGGSRRALSAEYMAVEEGGLRFYLNGGARIFFRTQEEGTELRIAGEFNGEEFAGLELPYRPLKSSRVRDEGNGQFVINADGQNYRFRGSGPENQVLILQEGTLPLIYGIADEDQGWRGENYVLAEGAEAGAYREALLQWAAKNYPLWGRLILSRNDEDMVIAYVEEALEQGSYRAALNAVPRLFLSAPRRTYESSVYLGGMAEAQRGLLTAESETLTRLTELIDRKNPAVFLESHLIEFLAVRNREDLINREIALIQNMDPLSLTLEQIPGLLEVRVELASLWPQALNGANSNLFEALTARAEFILSESLKRLPPMDHYPIGLVLAVWEGRANLEWNVRLGKALENWGELTGRETWAAIGRSIVLSILSLEDREGQIISTLNIDGEVPAGESPAYISAARLYRLLRLGNYRSRAQALSPAFPGLWAWTASPEIHLIREGQVLDIAVSFLAGESHYLLIQGLEPFYRLQFYGMDWRTDPNFERYDSSGWAYYTRDRTLILKIKHRADVEHIRLYTGSAPPSAPAQMETSTTPG
ncbi:MAG: hypothetical protein LBB77_08030 [Treponema sp.]|jgi:hypothetical protein|nr:hypothetical protein [Treponema sp.]